MNKEFKSKEHVPSLKVGLRGSALSLKQGEIFKNIIKENSLNVETELCTFKTSGDKRSEAFNQDKEFSKNEPDKLEWIFEIEKALVNKEIDIALHSAKDVPFEIAKNTKVLPLPNFESRFDVLLSKQNIQNLLNLPKNSKIGTSSLRRTRQLLQIRDDLEMVPLRGNIETRISFLNSGKFDAIILASAGLQRMGFFETLIKESNLSCITLSPPEFYPAVNQGILAVQIRDEPESQVASMFENLTSEKEQAIFYAERELVACLDANCRSALGVYCAFEKEELSLSCSVLGPSGDSLFSSLRGNSQNAKDIGKNLATQLIQKGAKELLF